MKKITTYFLCLMAVILILVSSSGISYVIHHCSDNHTSEFHLFTSDYECDHEKPETYCNQNSQHKSLQCLISKHHKCCSNTKGYFKVTDIYNFTRYQFKINSISFVNLNLFSIINHNIISRTYSFKNTYTPLIFNGRSILTLNSQLLI